jgi:hypothetical protein
MSSLSSATALMRLTPRDRVLVEVLHELRFLTGTQARQVCYPAIAMRSASRRLGVLRRRGVLECVSHRTFQDRRAFWGLAPLGRAAAAALLDIPPDWPRAAAVAALQMDHLVATNQIFCDLCREHHSGHLGPFRWFGSHRTHVDLGHTHLVPDAVILVASPEGEWWSYFLELDRGTMAREALAEKFERYSLMYRMAAERGDDPAWEARRSSWILVACPDSARAGDAARIAAQRGLERVWAGTAEECAGCLAAAVRNVALANERLPCLPPELTGGAAPPGRASQGNWYVHQRILRRAIPPSGSPVDPEISRKEA